MNHSVKKNTRKRKKKKKKNESGSSSSSSPAPSLPDDNRRISRELHNSSKAEDEEAKTMSALADAFSSMSIDQIASAYREAGGDAYKAAGILAADFVDPGENPFFGFKSSSVRRKPRTPATSTGTICDVIGKEYLNSNLNGVSNSKFRSEGRSKLPYSVEDAEQFLSSMLGDACDLGMGVVKDVLCQCGYDVQKALDALVGISDRSAPSIKGINLIGYRQSNHSSSCSELSSDSVGSIRKKIESTENLSDRLCHPYDEKHEFLQSVGYVCRDYTNVLTHSIGQIPSMSGDEKADLQRKVLACLYNIQDTTKHEPNSMNWKKVVKKVESFGQGLEYCTGSNEGSVQMDVNGKEDVYHFHRSTAKQHYEKMKDHYKRAADAYKKGERAHASILSDQGNAFRTLGREADEKASRDIFEARNKSIRNAVTIDLHGQHVKPAMGLLKLHLVLFAYTPSVHFLKVITGCGSDGAGMGKLKRSVIGLAKREGITWNEENSGTIVLELDGSKEYSFIDCQSDSD